MAKQTTQKSALIIYAHQEPKSFNAALKNTAVDTLKKLGYTVQVSDLNAQGFDPRATKDDFTGPFSNPDYLHYLNESKHAYVHSTLNDEIKAEVNKLRRADLIIFQFPIYWAQGLVTTLRFCGLDVMQPQISFSPEYSPESKRKEMLDNWSKRLEGLHDETPQSFVSTDNFDPPKWFAMKDEFIEKEANSDIAPSIGHHLGKKLSSRK